jgi:hypothetical protein
MELRADSTTMSLHSADATNYRAGPATESLVRPLLAGDVSLPYATGREYPMSKTRAVWIATLIVVVLTAAAAALLFMMPTKGTVLLFDGKTTSGWVIEGDAEVRDGALILGGNQKTRVRSAINFSPDFELHLEFSTENNQPIQLEWHKRFFLGYGIGSRSLDRLSEKPGEWIEAIYWGEERPAGDGWSTISKWRVVGEPAFTEQPLGGSASAPHSVVVAFEIPQGQKLHLRNVRVKTNSGASVRWLVVFVAAVLAVVLIISVAAWAIMKKSRAPTQGPALPRQTAGKPGHSE